MTDPNDLRREAEQRLAPATDSVPDTRGAGGILAKLWRQVLFDLNISPQRYEVMITDFVNEQKRRAARLASQQPAVAPEPEPEEPNEPGKKKKKKKKSGSISKGNLKRELRQAAISIKVLARGIMMLKPKGWRLILEIDHYNGRRTAHSVYTNTRGKDIDRSLLEDVFKEDEETEEA